MDSFEGLNVRPELLEALASEGIEAPTPLQSEMIPLIRKGRSLLVESGRGSGAFVAAVVGILEALGDETGASRVVVVTPSRSEAESAALSCARLASLLDLRTAALGGPWSRPEEAQVLVATPADLLDGLQRSRLKLERVGSVLVNGLGVMRAGNSLGDVETVLAAVPQDAQRIFLTLPFGEEDRRFAEAHSRRSVILPSDAGAPREEGGRRGRILYRVCKEDERDTYAAQGVNELLAADHEHVVLFFRSEDRAADVGDLLALRGFAAGAPGNRETPVWLAVDPLEGRKAVEDFPEKGRVATLGVDVPPDPDALDRRHGVGGESLVLTTAGEFPHLRRISDEAGYSLEPAPDPETSLGRERGERYRTRIRRTLDEHDLTAELLLLEPLFEKRAAVEVAAALSLMHRTASAPESDEDELEDRPESRPPAWVRLFLSVGKRDGVGPGDLLGAIAGEAGIKGDRVGRIDVRDTFSRVEVEEGAAPQVLRALNGTTLRGRSVRADYDREDRARAKGRDRKGGRE